MLPERSNIEPVPGLDQEQPEQQDDMPVRQLIAADYQQSGTTPWGTQVIEREQGPEPVTVWLAHSRSAEGARLAIAIYGRGQGCRVSVTPAGSEDYYAMDLTPTACAFFAGMLAAAGGVDR